MAVDVLTETIIDRPRDEVARYAGDPSNAPEWYVNIKSVEWKSEPRVVVGAKMAFVEHFIGRRIIHVRDRRLRIRRPCRRARAGARCAAD